MTGDRWIAVPPGAFPPRLHLRARALHLWNVPLDLAESSIRRCEALLSADERARAGRFIRPCDRRRYIVAHAALRLLLGRYAGVDCRVLSFVMGPHGKPALAEGGEAGLAFNMSHSGELAVVAISDRGQLGVDIEVVRTVAEANIIAQSYFSQREALALRETSPSEIDRAFLICWTRKEAFVKALGGGLSIGLDRFDVDLRLDRPALLQIDGDEIAARCWTMVHVDPEPGYVGAAVLDSVIAEVCCFRLEPGWQFDLETA